METCDAEKVCASELSDKESRGRPEHLPRRILSAETLIEVQKSSYSSTSKKRDFKNWKEFSSSLLNPSPVELDEPSCESCQYSLRSLKSLFSTKILSTGLCRGSISMLQELLGNTMRQSIREKFWFTSVFSSFLDIAEYQIGEGTGNAFLIAIMKRWLQL